jgi:hypothetical protein
MPELTDYLKKLEAVYKAAATDFKLSGNLTDQQTEAWFTHIFDKGQFLSRVTRSLRNMMSGNTGFIEGSNEALIRPVEGTEPTEIVTHAQRFSTYLLQHMMLPAFIGYSVIDDNPAHGLQNLAINGLTDTWAPGAGQFFTQGVGWVKLAQDSADTKKVQLVADDPRFDALDDLVEEMLLELDQEYREQAVIIMSDNEKRRRNRSLVQNTTAQAEAIAIAAMTEETRNRIGTKPVATPYFWPDGVFMLTNPLNLEVDIHRTVRRTIEEKPRRSGFEYTYAFKGDFQIIHHKAACIAYVA